MPEWLAESLKYVGPFGVFCLAVLVILVRDRRNNQRAGTNPGSNWQQDMRASQDTANATLARIEEGMSEACRLLTLIDDRQKREGT